ncbi:MAG: phosphoribosyltransferase [Brevundimonas sp.]|jgi:predicted phosphoribosyltransferase|uniref:phosphoribosyltransferase n=1 Tax=Brevundimonas sp. TaxID=1871086 RepID=UPI0025C2790A|nr:phosphoribosyltransferase family protein [Brevundimonas sp.]MCH4267283.1 phosphoribosyltransferase [Brevundimonas sp.]
MRGPTLRFHVLAMTGRAPLFRDRADAGRRLAEALAVLDHDRPLIYALPRGGVPVAFEIARRLDAPLDLILVRKIGAPGHPELALAAVVDGDRPHLVINEGVRRATGAEDAFIEQAQARELAEIERRRSLYFGARARPDPRGRTAVIVDDGLATGATALAAVHSLRLKSAARVILAVPVAPPEAVAALRSQVDALVCLETPEDFRSVGEAYADFHQLEDEEVLDLLADAADFGARRGPGRPGPSA